MHSVQLDDVVFGLNFRHGRSQSCPFCRDSLRRVDSSDLWIYTDKCDVVDLSTILRENCKRLFLYIDKLPLIIPDSVIVPYDSHVRWVLIFTGLLDLTVYDELSDYLCTCFLWNSQLYINYYYYYWVGIALIQLFSLVTT